MGKYGITLVVGLVLVGIGIMLVSTARDATDSTGERVTHGWTGQYSDRTTGFLLGGRAAIIAGAGAAVVGLVGMIRPKIK